MAIQIHYDSITKAAEDFGYSRQYFDKLIQRGDLVVQDIPGEQQRKRVWHQHVAEALAKTGSLRPHSCVCFDAGRLQGIEAGHQESSPQLAQVQQGLATALEELAQVKAQLVEVEETLAEAAQSRRRPTRTSSSQRCLCPSMSGGGGCMRKSTAGSIAITTLRGHGITAGKRPGSSPCRQRGGDGSGLATQAYTPSSRHPVQPVGLPEQG